MPDEFAAEPVQHMVVDAQLVVVTGAASGIGGATVRRLVDRGTRVIAVDLTSPVDGPASNDVEWVIGDVGDPETWLAVAAAARRHDARGADGLVACAGDVVVAPFLDTPITDWQRMFDVNVFGLVRALSTVLPDMVARGGGAAVAVCSVNSLFAEDQLSAYSTSKAAALHIVRSAALEYARHGIRINAVCPGAVDTPMFQRHLRTTTDPEATRRTVARRTPTGRLVQPDEVAAVITFLLGVGASAISGASVVVDGGLTTAYDFEIGPNQTTHQAPRGQT